MCYYYFYFFHPLFHFKALASVAAEVNDLDVRMVLQPRRPCLTLKSHKGNGLGARRKFALLFQKQDDLNIFTGIKTFIQCTYVYIYLYI